MGDGRSFIKATSFYTHQGAIFVSGQIFSLYLDSDNTAKYRTKSEDFPGLWVEIAKMKIALLLANLNTIKATSIRQILSPLVSDLKRLEVCFCKVIIIFFNNFDFQDRGLFIRERGITIKVRLAFVIGDNLGVSELLKFKQNFSTHFVCR